MNHLIRNRTVLLRAIESMCSSMTHRCWLKRNAALNTALCIHLVIAILAASCVSCASTSSGPGPKDADAPNEFTKTDSGLRYRILRKADGPKPSSSDEVTVHYRGWLDDQTVFDSSYKRGQPATFRLDQVVPGWTEGLQLVNEGGMIELIIPSHLGYGQQGAGGTIPGGATLHFIVELIRIE